MYKSCIISCIEFLWSYNIIQSSVKRLRNKELIAKANKMQVAFVSGVRYGARQLTLFSVSETEEW